MSHHSPPPSVSPCLCSRCGQTPALDIAPFCSACLLTPLGAAERPPKTVRVDHRYLTPGTVVGRYVTGELLGEGGFAEVYSAALEPAANVTPTDPTRVALKLIKRGMDSREILARFHAEQRTIQHLAHPGIVRLLDAGSTADGLPYFAMAQVDGLPITDHCEVAGLPLRDRLNLFLTLCDAVQHAHQRGVLHRDLKPSNILVEETPDGPVPRVIDFGIAKALLPGSTGHTLVTRLGQVLGTPVYMSPEQADGSDDADTRSDLYALGAVLYELLTGHPPFAPETLHRLPPGEWARHLRENLPPLASARLASVNGPPDRVRALRGDLDQIVRKAMAPDPAARYASADALANDVQRHLDDRPVSARPPSFRKQLRQLVRRHRWPVAVAAAVLAGIIATAGLGSLLAVRARRAEAAAVADKDRALAAERRADTARDRSEHQNYQAAIEAATMHLERAEPHLAAEKLRATPAELRGWEWGWLMAAVPPPEATAESGLANAGLLAATPDGAFAAVAAGNTLRVVDLRNGSILATRTFPGSLSRVALSADGQRLAAVETRPDGGETLHVSRPDGREPWTLPVGGLTDIAWEPPATGGAMLIVSGYGPTPVPGRLARFDPGTGRVLNERVITRFKAHAHSLFLGPAGRLAAAENSYKDLEIFTLPDLAAVATDTHPTGEGVDDVLLNDRDDHDPARAELVIARGANVYAGPARDPARPVVGTLAAEEPAAHVRYLNWLPDGRWLAVGETLALTRGGATARVPATGATAVSPLVAGRRLALFPSGRLEIRPEVDAPEVDGDLRAPLLAAKPPEVRGATRRNGARRSPSTSEIALGGDARPEGRGVAFTPDSRRVAFQPWRRNLLELVPLDRAVSGTDTLYPAARFPQQPAAEWGALPVVHPDGTLLTSVDNTLAAFRPPANVDGETVPPAAPVPIPHTDGAFAAAASADGRLLAVAVPTGVRLLDWPAGNVRREWLLPGGPFRVALLTAGPAVLAVGADAALHLLPLTGPPAAPRPMPFRVNGYYPAPLAFHPDPPLLAAALAGGGFAVYDLRPLRVGAPPRPLQRTPGVATATALAFSPDARRLAIAGDDHRLTLWDWPQALPLLGFSLNSTCASVAFSPDGEWLAHTDYAPSLVLRRAPPPGEK